MIQHHITFTREYQEVGVHLPQWQNVNMLLNKIFRDFEKSGIAFSAAFENLEIYADPLLEKVFYNLMENAIRYGVTFMVISIYPSVLLMQASRSSSKITGWGLNPGRKMRSSSGGWGRMPGWVFS